METFNLAVTTQELNYIMQVLVQRPYAECAAIVAKIQEQVSKPKEPKQPDAAQ